MTGFCGWFRLKTGPDTTSDIQAMRRHLPPLGELFEECNDARYSIASSALRSHMLHRSRSLVVVVDGTPEFSAAYEKPDERPARRIADLYQEHAANFTQFLQGNYAVALFDLDSSSCVLAVDRFGIRPLAYAIVNDIVIFGSTATAVQAHSQAPRGLDHQSLFNYLYFHMIPSPRTVFSGISKLAPAHQLEYSGGTVLQKRHWLPKYDYRGRRTLQGQLLSLLGDAVAKMSHPANVGAFLSGGLDSSTICGLLQKYTTGKAPVFTIGFAQEGYDELEFSKLATSHFGLDLTDYYITPDDVLSAIPEVASAYDEPFGNSSAVPTLMCARMAKRAGIEHLLAGDGGDELFGGNERYATQKLFSYYRFMPAWLDRAIMRPVFFRDAVKHREKGFQHKVRRYIEQASMPMPDRTQNYNLLHLLGAQTIFDKDFLRQIDPEEPVQLLRHEYWQDGPPNQLERLLLMDYKFTLADNDLRKVNRMCELAGLQVHYPMLDDKVVDFSNRIPGKVKLRGQELRAFFKQETTGFLPDKIIRKTKHGFGLPFGEWLKLDADLSSKISDNINDLRAREIFNPEFIDDLKHRHQNQHAAYYGGLVWVLAMLEEWLRQHRLDH